MENLSLINKYRPASFDEMEGHKTTIKSIKEVLNKKLGRSFLFVGGAGQGKTTLARIIAKEVDCPHPVEINGADHTGVDDMRGIIQTLAYKPLHGKSRVIIVDECHRLTANAWDSLLKSIEEPPENTYWILCTTNMDKIPKTIKTRCQIFELKPIPEDDLFNLMVKVCEAEGWDTGDEILDLIAVESFGSARQALSYLTMCHACKSKAEAAKLLSTASETPAVIDLARLLANGKATWKNTLPVVKSISGESAESVRIQLVNYLAVVLSNTDDENKACRLLASLQALSTPYNQSDKMAPLYLSLGSIIFAE